MTFVELYAHATKHTRLRFFWSSFSFGCVFDRQVDCDNNAIRIRFPFDPLSREFFDENAQPISVVGRPKRIEMYAISNENALV